MKAEDIYILVGCEESQAIANAFRLLGFSAFSCDLKPCSGGHPEWHIQGDVFNAVSCGYENNASTIQKPIITQNGQIYWIKKWNAAIFHPDCTYMTVSGLHWNKHNLERAKKTESSLQFVSDLMALDIPCIAIENPIGYISSRIRKPEQIIQPYQFNDDASKATCLWLKGFPLLTHTGYFPPRIVDGKKRWSNQDDNGQNKLIIDGKWIAFNDPRTKTHRSKTYPGIASAIAKQWGEYLIKKQAAQQYNTLLNYGQLSIFDVLNKAI